MLKVALKGILAKKARIVTTTLAIVLGVSFMAGTLVLTDTVGRTFDDLFADVNKGTDAWVRSSDSISTDFGADARARLDEGLVDVVAGVDGVAVAAPSIGGGSTGGGYAQIIGSDGEPVGDPTNGAPTFGANWVDDQDLNPFRLTDGSRAPAQPDEVVIDVKSAEDGDLRVGDRTTVLTSGPATEVTVVGTARFGTADSPGGAGFVMFTTETAQRLVGEVGKVDAIAVRADDGVSQEEVAASIRSVLPDGVEVLTGEEITKENQDDIAQALGFFNNFLLSFAIIALFVGAFSINNTFSIIVAQRTRELALLRAVGATVRQVRMTVIVEAVVLGVVASGIGLVAGVGVAGLLKALLAGFGFDLPSAGLSVEPRSMAIAFVVGVAVTLAASILPSRRASRVSPMAALRDVAIDTSSASRVRLGVGAAVTVLGIASVFWGLFASVSNPLPFVGFGAAATFLGVATLGPVFAPPVSRLVGAPLARLFGVTGRLARENALRNPRRTASTAVSLMIGVALVGFIAVLSASASASIDKAVDQVVAGDFIVDSGSFGFGGLPPELTAELDALPEVAIATGVRFTAARIDGDDKFVTGIDPASIDTVFDLTAVDGSTEDWARGGLAVNESLADDHGWKAGDVLPATFVDTGDTELTIQVIYEDSPITNGYTLDHATYDRLVADVFDASIFIEIAPGVDVEKARSAIETVTAAYPTAEVQDLSEFKASQAAQVNQLLGLVAALLLFAVLIGGTGIANTLSLSTLERTRELGLLRAVGTTRRQLRAVVRGESVIISLLGALIGITVALLLAIAFAAALADEGFSELRVPFGLLAIITIFAGMVGVAAAALPARRAAKLNVLDAIATE